MALKYDIFTFNDELDMLEIRLNILNDYVDYFVIVEATETFSGVPKPLYYELNKERFKEFAHKIIHYVITDTPKDFNDKDCDQHAFNLACNSDNVSRDILCWLKEFYQKELIKNALTSLHDEDICYISDVDEIWNYNLTINVEDIPNNPHLAEKYNTKYKVYKPMITNCYINYLNVKTSEKWTVASNPFTGPIVTTYKNVKESCLNHLRTIRKTESIYIEDGGWHFNALGGIINKINSFKHPIYTIGYMKGREAGSVIDENSLPEYILNNKEKYKHLFK